MVVHPPVPPSAILRCGTRARILRYAPGTRQRPHAHGRASLALVLRGSLEERVGTLLERAAPLSAVLKPAGLEHANEFGAEGAVTLQIVLSREREAELRSAGHDVGSWRWIHAGEVIRPMLGIASAIARDRTPEPGGAVLDDLLIEAMAALEPAPPRRPGPDPPWLRRAREALGEEAVPIRLLASDAGMHPVQLAREFRRSVGMPPTEYRRRARLGRAFQSLAVTGAPLADAALGAGYADQSHMTREFRRVTGLTPLRCRGLLARV